MTRVTQSASHIREGFIFKSSAHVLPRINFRLHHCDKEEIKSFNCVFIKADAHLYNLHIINAHNKSKCPLSIKEFSWMIFMELWLEGVIATFIQQRAHCICDLTQGASLFSFFFAKSLVFVLFIIASYMLKLRKWSLHLTAVSPRSIFKAGFRVRDKAASAELGKFLVDHKLVQLMWYLWDLFTSVHFGPKIDSTKCHRFNLSSMSSFTW